MPSVLPCPSAILDRLALSAASAWPLRGREPHQAPMSGCDNRGLHRGSGRRLDIDRIGAALPVDGATAS